MGVIKWSLSVIGIIFVLFLIIGIFSDKDVDVVEISENGINSRSFEMGNLPVPIQPIDTDSWIATSSSMPSKRSLSFALPPFTVENTR